MKILENQDNRSLVGSFLQEGVDLTQHAFALRPRRLALRGQLLALGQQ
jgi:hypothetical protein